MSLRMSSHFMDERAEDGDDVQRGTEYSSSGDDEEDLTWEDWVSDSVSKRPCKSLFDETKLTSVAEIVEWDRLNHGFDLDATCKRLSLDQYQRIRLINWIRKEKPSPKEVNGLTGREELFSADSYLIPTLEDDPLLQAGTDDWTDSEEDDALIVQPSSKYDAGSASRKIAALEKKLKKSKEDLANYRGFVGERLNLASLAEALKEPGVSSTHDSASLRDDDSHYFQSYGENDIHAVMIQDKVRTASYAKFILTSPELFKDAIVLDVGCGTGILSLFAARAGAKRVFAVDASDIAEKAERIVKANNFEHVITVIRGKVEDIKLPDGITHVDVIISEWMGYALLYESMLDSVLSARDRFLKPEGGVMAPSQCRMMFGLCEAGDVYKERVGFWGDVYGFDLSAMGTDVYEDAIVDVVGSNTLSSEPVVVKDLYLNEVAARQLDFSSSFKLIANNDQKQQIHAFVLYFDTFFAVSGERLPDETQVYVAADGDPILAEVWQIGRKPHTSRRMSSGDPLKKPKPKYISFSTGPASVPTHWKQTLFLLREPIAVREGSVVQGIFKCRKSEGNSRELDVEIHYSVRDPEATDVPDVIVQTYKVR
ncbi:hypothetical protein EUX98_g4825 [Antrodiella citrinella]|uniref:type I protein arginine methyltransferase n=1 Tax=Antrodiella citrinella TaxID=2447956 RepID=A0A4V3XII4_9APHY|nr:hypothetical protein EUX98_g4825 [Antrodiella citrinella]